MTKGSGRFALSYVPGLKNNAVLQLILAIGVAYCLLAISWAIIMIVDNGKDLVYNAYFMPNISLTALPVLKTHLWTRSKGLRNSDNGAFARESSCNINIVAMMPESAR